MSKPMIRIHNTETDTVIDREMTDAEYAVYQAEQVAAQEMQDKVQAQATAKAAAEAKLAALGLTTDDLKALGLGGN